MSKSSPKKESLSRSHLLSRNSPILSITLVSGACAPVPIKRLLSASAKQKKKNHHSIPWYHTQQKWSQPENVTSTLVTLILPRPVNNPPDSAKKLAVSKVSKAVWKIHSNLLETASPMPESWRGQLSENIFQVGFNTCGTLVSDASTYIHPKKLISSP